MIRLQFSGSNVMLNAFTQVMLGIMIFIPHMNPVPLTEKSKACIERQ